MNPMFADAIDLPFVFLYGMGVLVPLMLFQVGVEAWILSYIWRGTFRDMTRFTFRANCWSLAAGIPTKLLNALLYGMLLPPEIPEFFARYPYVVGLGTFLYFLVTVLVERAYAIRWLHVELPPPTLWRGILVANLATYAVLAPLHYYATRPINDVREFARDAHWTKHAETQIAFTDAQTGHLKIKCLGELAAQTIVPTSVKDYLISSNAAVCLFRGEGGTLVLYQRNAGRSNLVWQTDERFSMNQVAFSPSAERVAFVSEKGSYLEVMDLPTGKRVRQQLRLETSDPVVAWSPEEEKLFISLGKENQFIVTLTPDMALKLEAFSSTSEQLLLVCFGRVGPSRWFSGDNWGQSYSSDVCGDLRAWALPGLGSSLRVQRNGAPRKAGFAMAVNPGLLHLSAIQFREVSFLEGCQEVVFEAGESVYLIDLEQKRLGTVANGERFILLTSRYRKHL